jgi:hypothetical protein
MDVVPAPTPEANGFNKSVVEPSLDSQEKLTAEFVADQSETTIRLPVLAISKHPNMVYTVRVDGQSDPIYGPSRVPPTDPDNLEVTFLPAKTFDRSLTVTVENIDTGSTSRKVIVKAIGWEEV